MLHTKMCRGTDFLEVKVPPPPGTEVFNVKCAEYLNEINHFYGMYIS